MKLLKKILWLCISYFLGYVLNILLSPTEKLKISGKEIFDYEKPFIYILKYEQVVMLLFITLIIGFFSYLFYKKDKRVIKILRNVLFIEICFFLFSLGTLGRVDFGFIQKIIEDIKPLSIKELMVKLICKIGNIIEYLSKKYVLFSLLFISFIVFLTEDKEENNVDILNPDEKLYKSREIYIKVIEEHLENMNSFSIIGKWGIGKTKLIRNFFYGKLEYKDKYEIIYIDSSIYSQNEKLISVLEKELNRILEKYGYLKLDGKFIKNLFLEDNGFLKIIYRFMFGDISLRENKKELEEKLEEIKNRKKEIVVCLDNIERLNSRKRITEILAILDEILPSSVKRIYIYDEEHLKNIFEKDKYNFFEYINKYIDNKIEITGCCLDEIFEDEEQQEVIYEIERIKEKIEYNKNRMINETLLNEFKRYQDSAEIREKEIKIIEKIEKKKQEVDKKLSIPRYLINLKKYIDTELKELKEIKQKIKSLKDQINLEEKIKELNEIKEKLSYTMEYKIIRDNFPRITPEEIISNIEIRNILGFTNLINYNDLERRKQIERLTIEDIMIERLCAQEFFKEDLRITLDKALEEDMYRGNKNKIRYFKKIYSELEFKKDQEKILKEKGKNLFEYIDVLKIKNNSTDLTQQIKKSLNYNFIYKLNITNGEMEKLLFSNTYINNFEIILEKLRISKLDKISYKIHYISYLRYINYLIQYNLKSIKKYKEFDKIKKFEEEKKLPREERLKNELNKIKDFFNKEFENILKDDNLDDFSKLLDKLFKKIENKLEDLGLNKEKMQLAIEGYKKICKIKELSEEEEKNLEKKEKGNEIVNYLRYCNPILNYIGQERNSINLGKKSIKLPGMKILNIEDLKITEDNIDLYMEKLKDKSFIEEEIKYLNDKDKEDFSNNLISLKIELEKLKEKIENRKKYEKYKIIDL